MSTPDSSPLPGLEQSALRMEIASDIHADAAATALGLNRTDFSCLRLLWAEGPLTAGRLAERTGLTTGAITGILDRLERLGLSERDTDPQDRRRVIALVSSEARQRLAAFVGVTPRPSAAGDAPSTDAGFLDAWAESLDAETERLRATGGRTTLGADASGSVSVPLGDLRRGSFEVVGGAMDVTLSGGRAMPDDLIRARLDDALRISERDGHVRLAHRSRFQVHRPSAEVQLNADVPWALRVSGGANHATFNLAGLDITAIEVEGGAAHAEFNFSETARNIAFQLSGGASHVTVRVPRSLPVSVSLRGILKFSVDGRPASVGRDMPWRSAGSGSGEGSLTITVKGGANSLAIEGVGAQGGPVVSL